MLIINNCQLKQFYHECQKNKCLGIDTEFHWVETYKPIPCLIQMSNNSRTVIIDCLENKVDFSLIKKLLLDKKILKIFHSGRQDLEIFSNLFNIIPKNIFDTQIGVLPLGFKLSSSYAKICKDLLAIKIVKENQRLDWRKRPLSKAQIVYASNDVKYLIHLYKKIISKLMKYNRKDWIDQMHAKLISKKHYFNKTKEAWKRVKINPKYSLEKKILKKISEFREKQAIIKNVPAKKIFNDSQIIKIIKLHDKCQIKQSIKSINKKQYSELLKIIKKEINSTEKNVKLRIMNENENEKFLIAKKLLKQKSENLNIESSLIATNKELKELILKKKKNLLKGWKYKVFGKYYEKIDL